MTTAAEVAGDLGFSLPASRRRMQLFAWSILYPLTLYTLTGSRASKLGRVKFDI